jgi:hypothetical protein
VLGAPTAASHSAAGNGISLGLTLQRAGHRVTQSGRIRPGGATPALLIRVSRDRTPPSLQHAKPP